MTVKPLHSTCQWTKLQRLVRNNAISPRGVSKDHPDINVIEVFVPSFNVRTSKRKVAFHNEWD